MEQKETTEKIIPRKLLLWITIVIAVGLVLLSLLSIYFVFIYPENQVSQLGITNITEKANYINQTRTTFISFFVLFAQILGGGAVAIGIYFAWGNLKVALATLESNQNKARNELKLAQEALIADQNKARDELELAQNTLEANMKIAQENLKVAQEGQITERFTRAIDQLGAIDKDGNPAIEIRLGGIYALERIANESKKDYWPVMEILTAYVRKNSPAKNKLKGNYLTSESISMDIQANESTISRDPTIRDISLDIQAILTVIGKCNHYLNEGKSRLNLHMTYLEGAYLTGAHLERASFYGAHLKRALLDGAHLEGAYFADAFLEGALLDGAFLEGAFLRNAHLKVAYLRNAHLEGASLERANLEYAYLEGANLEYAYLLNTNLEGAYLGYANLKGAIYLKIDQLSKAQTLYKAELDPEIEKPLKEKYPDLFREAYIIDMKSIY